MTSANGRRRGRVSKGSRGTRQATRTNARHGTAADLRAPGFVFCAARSGSTLLRLILNAHPEIACPPETNLVEIFAAIGFSVSTAAEPGRNGHDSARFAQDAQRAAELSRTVADEILGEYAKTRGKAMWIDKSLPSVFFAELLAQIYPGARFICLYRQCPDTIASLHEASSWAYDSFGVLPYVRESPGNLVQALAAYWVDRVEKMRAFEEANPDQVLRVRYEDLVSLPETTVREIFGFLGVSSDEATVEAALSFEPRVSAVMPGDVKARFARGIDASSVGRGWSVPLEMVSAGLRERVDALSQELGYAPLPNLKQYVAEPATPLLCGARTEPRSREITQILDEQALKATDARPTKNGKASSVVKLVLTDFSEPWMVDLKSGRVEKRDGKAQWLALTDSTTLMSLVSGRSNPGTAMRNSRIQVVSASDNTRPDEFLDCVDELMTLLRR